MAVFYKMSCGLHKAKALLESKLAVQFEERDSCFYGGTYYLARSQGWYLFRNRKPKDGDEHIVDFDIPAKTVLQCQSGTPAAETQKRLLSLGCLVLT